MIPRDLWRMLLALLALIVGLTATGIYLTTAGVVGLLAVLSGGLS